MKRNIILIISVLLAITSQAQKSYSDKELGQKLDSIISEANMLYNYEKAAWKSSDIFVKKEELIKQSSGYLVYHSNDTIHGVFYDKTHQKRIALFSFKEQNLEVPFEIDYTETELTKAEKILLGTKVKIFTQLSNPNLQLKVPKGYSPNFILIEGKDHYRFYMIMGTSYSQVIPLGNDYLFNSDLDGNIRTYRKFHNNIIPASTKLKEKKVVSVVHSHNKGTPFITATDICTFRLYGELYDIDELKILSTALDCYFVYNRRTNKIKVEKK